MILSLEAYTMINEGFTSSVISKLFKHGELDAENKDFVARLNQIKDDEIVGIAGTKEEAQKMLNQCVGDKIEIRYPVNWHYGRSESWEPETDYDHPYKFNRTVDGYEEWIIQLNSGKYLVLKIEKQDLRHRLNDIQYERKRRKQETVSELRTKLERRKEFVNKNKDDIKKYWEFKKYLEEKGLLDEFIETINNTLDNIAEHDIEYYESEIMENDGSYTWESDDDSIELANLGLYIEYEGEFDGCVRSWYYPQTYWEPGDEGCEITDGCLYITPTRILVFDEDSNDNEPIFEFNYSPDFEQNQKHVFMGKYEY